MIAKRWDPLRRECKDALWLHPCTLGYDHASHEMIFVTCWMLVNNNWDGSLRRLGRLE